MEQQNSKSNISCEDKSDSSGQDSRPGLRRPLRRGITETPDLAVDEFFQNQRAAPASAGSNEKQAIAIRNKEKGSERAKRDTAPKRCLVRHEPPSTTKSLSPECWCIAFS